MGSKVGNFCVTLNFMSTEYFYFFHYHSIFYKMDKIRGVAQWKRVGPITQRVRASGQGKKNQN